MTFFSGIEPAAVEWHLDVKLKCEPRKKLLFFVNRVIVIAQLLKNQEETSTRMNRVGARQSNAYRFAAAFMDLANSCLAMITFKNAGSDRKRLE
jgi:hypothetical protein